MEEGQQGRKATDASAALFCGKGQKEVLKIIAGSWRLHL
jgi:hypothetical protein